MMRSNAPTTTIPNADTRSICHSVGPRVIDSEESVAEPNRGTADSGGHRNNPPILLRESDPTGGTNAVIFSATWLG
jgi:hypothetical protein